MPSKICSFHVNSGAADCAIHMRLDYNTNGVLIDYAAVLVDAGRHDYIKLRWCIQGIQARYNIATLRFKAIVITHWDEDHYGGIDGMLCTDTSLSPQNPQWKHFVYDQNAPMHGTTVYCPYFPPVGRIGGLIFTPDVNKQNTGYFGCLSSGGQIDQLARASSGPDIIGTDFFSGDRNVANWETVSFADLITSHVWKHEAAMFCVASNVSVIGHTDIPRLDLTTTKAFLYKLDSTDKNKSSIAAIIAWNNNKVSHYFAGDLGANEECAIADWLSTSVKKVHVMKSSHHGSRGSNPPVLLDRYNPTFYVISAGRRYGHPCE
jgi:hypothetical protein